MGIVFKNNAKTTLASSLSSSATSATVTDGSVFPSLNAGEFFLITFDDGSNNEICKCTARSSNTLTIVRAQESTTARAFSSGDSAEGRVTAGVLEQIQENIASKSANQTVFNATTAGGATTYNIGTNPGVEANAMVFLNGVLQHHNTLSFSGTNLTFDAAPPNGMALEVIIDNLINLQSSNLTVDTFTAADITGNNTQTDFVLSDTPAAETNLIVFVDGVFQDQDSYTISSNTLTITDEVIAGRGVTVYVINPVNIGTPSDSTVTSAKLSGNITMPGTLTVGSNDVAFDSPTFVVDHANSRVGLGTASPSVPVDIVGDVKMSADLTVDTTTLVVDSSNNRVGIGTSSPDDLLDVENGNIRLRSNSEGNTGLLRMFDASGTESAQIYPASGDLKIYSPNDVLFTQSGNVGIGNTNPSSFNSNSNNLVVGSGSGGQGITIYSASNNNAQIFFADGTSGDAAYRGVFRYAHDVDRFEFFTAGAIKAVIDSSGNVGIGTTDFNNMSSSSYKGLKVGGAVLQDSGGGNGSATWLGNNAYVGSGNNFYFDGGGTASGIQMTSGDINFYTFDGGGGSADAQWSPPARMHIKENGQIGIAHTSPAYTLDVDGDIFARNRFFAGDGTAASASIRFNNASSGLYHPGSDALGFTTAGSERMRIDNAGALRINNTSTIGSNDEGVLHLLGKSAHTVCKMKVTSNSQRYIHFFDASNNDAGSVQNGGGASTVYNTSSDYRMKENYRPLENGLERLSKLNPIKFKWKHYDIEQEGFLAHEAQEVFPDAVTGDKDGIDKYGKPEMQQMDYGRITPLLVKAIQEQQVLIEALQKEVEELKGG